MQSHRLGKCYVLAPLLGREYLKKVDMLSKNYKRLRDNFTNPTYRGRVYRIKICKYGVEGMSKYYIGDPDYLREKGFLQDIYKTYWFYPKLARNQSIFIHVKDGLIECSHDFLLDLIDGLYEER